MDTSPENASPLVPSKQRQSWGALLSIVVIMLMIIGGALYAWQKHEAEVRSLKALTETPEADTTATTTP